jgi:hypothetical protein
MAQALGQAIAVQQLQMLEEVLALGALQGAGGGNPLAMVAPRSVGAVDEARGLVQGERARLQQEKFTFKPEEREKVDKFNEQRAKRNAEFRAKGEHDKVKPLIDLHQVTSEVEGVMRDDSIPDKDKKKHIEEIRKKYDIPHHAPKRRRKRRGWIGVSMHEMFTGRLAAKTNESAKRVKEERAELKAGLTSELKDVEALYGKDSAEAVALRGQIDEIDGALQIEQKQLEKEGNALHHMYKPRRRFLEFLKKAFKWIGKILDFAMPFLKMIPGVGQIIGAVWGGVKTIAGFIKGEGAKALRHLAHAVPLAGGAIAGALGTVGSKILDIGQKVVKYAKKGIGTIRSAIRGDVGGVIGGIAGIAGDAGAPVNVTDALGHVAKGGRIVERAARKDVVGALNAAGGFADGLGAPVQVGDALGHAATGVGVLDRAVRGDVEGALRGVNGIVSETTGVDPFGFVEGKIDEGLERALSQSRLGGLHQFSPILED